MRRGVRRGQNVLGEWERLRQEEQKEGRAHFHAFSSRFPEDYILSHDAFAWGDPRTI